MTKNERHKVEIKNMLERIVAYLQARFRESPELSELRFSSSRELCSTLNKAGVNLWIFSDAGVSAKLYRSCQHDGIVKGVRHNGEWTFFRHDYI